MKKKKLLSFLLVLALLLTMPGLPTSASAKSAPAGRAALARTEVSVEGTDDLGSMLAKEISRASADEAERESQSAYITDLTVSGDTAEVTYFTGGAADIAVAVYEEDTMRMAASGKVPVEAGEAVSTVMVEITGDMPDHFIATAYMMDRESHGPLCDSYTTNLYGEAMQRVEEATLDDFADDQTVNLDDSRKTNFVVYSGTTKVIPYREGRDQVTENDDGTYTVTDASEDFTSLKKGEIFSYSNEDGTLLLVKVADISVSGDTVRITEEEGLDLESVFDVIKVEGGVKTAPEIDPAQAGRKKAEYSAEKSVTKSIEVNRSGEALGGSASGTLILSGSLTISGYVKAYAGWGEKHIEAKASLLLTGDFSLDGALETEIKLLKDAPKITLCSGVTMKVTPVLVVKFNGKLETDLKVTAAVGAAYNSKRGLQNLSEDPKVELDINVEGTLYVGLKPEAAVVVLSDKFATANVSAEAGAALKMAYQKKLTNSMEAESEHICDLCIAGTLDLSIRVDAKLTFFKKSLFDDNVVKKDFPNVGRCHYSFDYSEFAWTDCPHIAYRVTVSVTGQGGGAAAGVAVQGTELDSDPVTGSDGTAVFYLPNGSYNLNCSDGNSSGTVALTVSDAVETVSITLGVNGEEPGASSVPVSTPDSGGTSVPTAGPGASSAPGGGSSEIIASGECGVNGDNIIWQLDEDGLLTISGSGDMKDYSGGGPWYQDQDYGNHIKKIQMNGNITSIGDYAFDECAKLTEAVLPDSVTSIGDHAFSNCPSLTSIAIPDHVTLLGKRAFEGCSKLPEITIPGDIATIGEYAFYNCVSLKKVTIQEGVAVIGGGAFNQCNNLTEIIMPISVVQIDSYAFGTCSRLSDVYYAGSESDWATIQIYYVLLDRSDCSLFDASIHYNGTDVSGTKTGASFPRRAASGKKTARFTGLEPDTAYIFLAVRSSDTSDILAVDNLLYIAQDTADEDGELTFLYEPKTGDSAKLRACGLASYKEMSDGGAEGLEQSGSPEPESTPSMRGTQPPVTGRPGSTPFVNGTLPPETIEPISTPFVDSALPSPTPATSSVAASNGGVTGAGPIVTSHPSTAGTILSTDKARYIINGELTLTYAEPLGLVKKADGIIVPYTVLDGLKKYTVTVIGPEAFAGCIPLKTIVIPASIKEIGANAFADCSHLTEVVYGGTRKDWNKISIGSGNQNLIDAYEMSHGDLEEEEERESDTASQRSAFRRRTVRIKSVRSPAKKRAKIRWARLSGASGYQVQYSKKYSMKNSKKRSAYGTSVLLTGLKRRRYYYVRVRAYKFVNGARVYSRWSGKRSVRIR